MGLKEVMKKFVAEGNKIRKDGDERLVKDTKETHKEMMETVDTVPLKDAVPKAGRLNLDYLKKFGGNVVDSAKRYGELYKETGKEVAELYKKKEEEGD